MRFVPNSEIKEEGEWGPAPLLQTHNYPHQCNLASWELLTTCLIIIPTFLHDCCQTFSLISVILVLHKGKHDTFSSPLDSIFLKCLTMNDKHCLRHNRSCYCKKTSFGTDREFPQRKLMSKPNPNVTSYYFEQTVQQQKRKLPQTWKFWSNKNLKNTSINFYKSMEKL